MRIAESARVPLQQYIKPGSIADERRMSDVSREERQHLLTGIMQSRATGTVSSTYSERAQLLSVAGSPKNSWVA